MGRGLIGASSIGRVVRLQSPPPTVQFERHSIAGAFPTVQVGLTAREMAYNRVDSQMRAERNTTKTGPRLSLIVFVATICMFVASTALTGNAPVNGILVATAAFGVIGTLSAGASALLAAEGAYAAATRMLFLSSLCGGLGALGIVAGTQSWEVTLATGGCTLTTLMVTAIVRRTRKRAKRTDAEVGLPHLRAQDRAG